MTDFDRDQESCDDGPSSNAHSPRQRRRFGTPRYPTASFILSFDYLIRPACGVIGLGLYLFWNSLGVPLSGASSFLLAVMAFFAFWFGAPIGVGLLMRNLVAADTRILVFRAFSEPIATAGFVPVFSAYGHTRTVLDPELGGAFRYALQEQTKDPFGMIAAAEHLHFGTDENWQKGVTEALTTTDIAVVDLLAAPTKNVKWEYCECGKHLPNHRIIVIGSRKRFRIGDRDAMQIVHRSGGFGFLSVRLRLQVYRAMKEIIQHEADNCAR